MPETIYQLKDILSGATDNEGNVLDMVAVNHVIVSLEGMTITPEDLHLLQATRIVKKVQDVRRKTEDSKLAKRIKKLVKKWQSLLGNYTPTSGVVNSKHVNGMIPAENGIDAKSKQTFPTLSGSILPNTNNSSSFVDANQKSLKLKQQLCSANVQIAVRPNNNATSNSAPHPISADCKHKVYHTNRTVVKFVHPPPEPMPSSLIVSISRHTVKLKEQPTIPFIHISTDDSTGNSHVTANINSCSVPEDTPFDAHFMDTSSNYNNFLSGRNLDELLGIKSEPSTGKHTPVDEIISSDGYLLDMNIDYSSIMLEADRVFNSEDLTHVGTKVEGIDGYFGCGGTWCDWTQPIPAKDEESVVVLPYVYID